MDERLAVANFFEQLNNTSAGVAGAAVNEYNHLQNVNASYAEEVPHISAAPVISLESAPEKGQDTHQHHETLEEPEETEGLVKPCSVKLARLTNAEITGNAPKTKKHSNDNNNNINTNGRRKLIDDSFLMPPPPPPVSSSANGGMLRQRPGGGKNICLFCAKTFSQSKLLESHMNVHTRERPFECPHCDESFSFPAVLWVHERRHLGHSYICKFCNKAYTAPTNLSAHIKAHHQNEVPPPLTPSLPPPLVTPIVPMPPNSNPNVTGKPPPRKKKKLNSESGAGTIPKCAIKPSSPNKQQNKTFPCSSCPQTFTTKRRLKLHVTMEHPTATSSQPIPLRKTLSSSAPDVFRCEQCAQEFSSDGEMKRHMCTYNNDESRPQLWQNYPVEAPDVRYHTMVNPMECYLTAEDRQFFDMICNM